MPLPPPSLLKRKILIKNKRLKPEVEKIELELFQQGQLALDNEEPTEDASAAPVLEKKPTEDEPPAALPGASQVKSKIQIFLWIEYQYHFIDLSLPFHRMVVKVPKFRSTTRALQQTFIHGYRQ